MTSAMAGKLEPRSTANCTVRRNNSVFLSLDVLEPFG
jgi:hypothetical protein